MQCNACGTDNDVARKFCRECGAPLSVICPSCGRANTPNDKYCGECGSALLIETTSATGGADGGPETGRSGAERRLVSVLFADLVGFTSLSESRDPEETRDLLSRYFDTCRRLVGLYGGVVEKFIGDAVMAIWGAPIAREDDAERAVRAGLELTAAVRSLGQEIGAPELQARAGVLTGEAAVTVGAEGQGMVAGDLVNTASRIQSVAPPGAVFVGEVTHRATEAAIAYVDAGTHELKGKAEPAHLWQASRVVAGAGGAKRSTGLEPPFVGRDREFRLIKELFHAAAEEQKAHLVSVVGIAGIGKSRLTWEFEKYVDGLATETWWHRGRCLSYGEGVAYWALAEMVRSRCGIAEDEDPASALAKLHATLDAHVPDAEERRWVEPRLAHLLGLEDRPVRDQETLFSAWRVLFERLAEKDPLVMVFEDIQWADSSLLDFIEYLLEWSRNHPLFIVTLARPEFVDRRPGWGAGKRSFTSLYLEALSAEAMEGLLSGLVPGLSEDIRGRILARAEGVPLYAVETVRMLLDQGVLSREGDVYRLTRPTDELDVPETLHALIAARLDGLTAEERPLIQDAAVLGKTFTLTGLSALTGTTAEELQTLLSSLVRKEVLTLQADPRSPERGQYGFLQDLVKRVAYETISKRDRKAKHVAAASFLSSQIGSEEDDIVPVVAAHYLDAYALLPDADDAEEIKAKARSMLVRAGERAASLAATDEAQRYFEQSAELADEDVKRADLLERAGVEARAGGRADAAIGRFEESIALFEKMGLGHPAARVSARLGEVMWETGKFGEAVERMDRSFQVMSEEERDEDFAALAAQLGRIQYFAGQARPASERIEQALDVAEALWLPEILSQALNTKAVILYGAEGRRREGLALLRYALEVALENDLPSASLRAYYNLADLAGQSDRYQEAADYVHRGLALARRVGNRIWEWQFLGQTYTLVQLGDWDDVLEMTAQLPRDVIKHSRVSALAFVFQAPLILVHRGDLERARQYRELFPDAANSDDVQERALDASGEAALLLAEGDHEGALMVAQRAIDARGEMGIAAEGVKESLVFAMESALALGELGRVDDALAVLKEAQRGRVPQYLQAHAMRFRARLAERHGDLSAAEEGLKEASGLFREMAVPFWMAVAELELSECLVDWGRGQEAVPLVSEAREIFERLKAAPWLERAAKLESSVAAGA
jgi:class 3 adenylate cyclase/tetratricopeptide (TPR) repeat protein